MTANQRLERAFTSEIARTLDGSILSTIWRRVQDGVGVRRATSPRRKQAAIPRDRTPR